jgi:hypothetical protein
VRRLTAERLGCGADDLLGRDVALVLGEPPAMAEGVGDLPLPVSPERIPKRVQHLGTRSYRAFPECIQLRRVRPAPMRLGM